MAWRSSKPLVRGPPRITSKQSGRPIFSTLICSDDHIADRRSLVSHRPATRTITVRLRGSVSPYPLRHSFASLITQGRCFAVSIAAMARPFLAGHNTDLCPHDSQEREESDGGDEPVTRTGCEVITLIPASQLRFKPEWDEIAANLPRGAVLPISPPRNSATGKRLQTIVTELARCGHHVVMTAAR